MIDNLLLSCLVSEDTKVTHKEIKSFAIWQKMTYKYF